MKEINAQIAVDDLEVGQFFTVFCETSFALDLIQMNRKATT